MENPTEIERAACTLLGMYASQVASCYPVFKAVTGIVRGDGDPLETLELLNDYHPNSTKPKYKFSDEERPFAWAVFGLAGAICQYRMHGRPEGDQETRLGENIVVTTSLAAAVVEFHERILAAVYETMEV